MASPSSQSSIADLSYRNYDGPINAPNNRWMVIAKAMIAKSLRLKSLWVFTLLSGWYFIAMIVILFFVQEFTGGNTAALQAFQSFENGLVWKDQMLHGFGFSQHLLLVVALIVGAGTIANDSRANALLVYLSKPCRKIDYLMGKWVGVFVPILIVISIPSIFFYLYGLFSFSQQGFFKSDPYLLLRMLCVLPLAAAVHASLIIAVSSMFKQGSVAGAVYAGIYFMGYFFTLLIKAFWFVQGGKVPPVLGDLYYCSIDGIQIGLAKAILLSGNTLPFGRPAGDIPSIPAPPLIPYLGIVVAIIGGSLWFTWTRIRAVEVI